MGYTITIGEAYIETPLVINWKPKFKIGDRVCVPGHYSWGTVTSIDFTGYYVIDWGMEYAPRRRQPEHVLALDEEAMKPKSYWCDFTKRRIWVDHLGNREYGPLPMFM